MTSDYILDTIERDSFGSSSVKKLRRQGMVPANFYFHGSGSLNLAIDRKTLQLALQSGQHIFVINVGKKKQHVQIKELQYHPVTDDIMHVDLMGFKMTEKISITVPLVIVGEAPGVKLGGILTQNLNLLDIYCLPADIPENIEVDISTLDVGQHISVSDLVVAENIEIQSSPETPIIAIQVPRGEEAVEVIEGEIEGLYEEEEAGEEE
ncbi:MAG: 50S ribosomal protein L25 [Candidatus Marinimicrobia bacterium]|nr:50S ribosomal protein L25 [Candidatus Neomarinimicrobiota bacterium]